MYAIIATTNPSLMKVSVESVYGDNCRQFTDNIWLVHDTGSTKDIADKVHLTDGANGCTGVVLAFSGYSGFENSDNWVWLARHPEALPNG